MEVETIWVCPSPSYSSRECHDCQNRFSTLLCSDNGLLLLLAVCGALLHVLLNGQYGFHRDELDILMNARQLDWGYVAYPPLTPLIARIGLELFGNSLQGLRLFSALSQGVVMVLAGLMARDMGGKRGGTGHGRDCGFHRSSGAHRRHSYPVHGLRLRVVGADGVLHGAAARHG